MSCADEVDHYADDAEPVIWYIEDKVALKRFIAQRLSVSDLTWVVSNFEIRN